MVSHTLQYSSGGDALPRRHIKKKLMGCMPPSVTAFGLVADRWVTRSVRCVLCCYKAVKSYLCTLESLYLLLIGRKCVPWIFVVLFLRISYINTTA